MINKQQLMQIARSNPKIQQAVAAIAQQVGDIPPEMLDSVIKALELVLSDPSQYPRIRQMAIQQGLIDEQSIPPQFEPTFVISLLVAFYGLQERAKRMPQQMPQQMPTAPTGTLPHFAQGGLAQHAQRLQSMGRGGDTMLAHINPREAAVLARMGGSGTVNPNTGLREFKGGGLGGLLRAVLPIALNFIAPGIGTAIGTAMGATGAMASAIGGAMIGGATSALGGGNFLQGAALGALGGGAGEMVGGAANSAMGLGLGQAATSALGSGLIGGAVGAATGQGFAKGALMGAAGNYIGNQFGQAGGAGAVGTGMREAGKSFGNMMGAGYDPRTSVIGGGLAGLTAGMLGRGSGPQKTPAETVVGGLKMNTGLEGLRSPGVSDSGIEGGINPYSLSTGAATPTGANYELMGTPKVEGGLSALQTDFAPSVGAAVDAPPSGGGGSSMFGGDNLMMKGLVGMQVLNALQGAPAPVVEAVSSMSPSQQEYFGRPSITWDWGKMQKDATASGQTLTAYLAQNWNKVVGGEYNNKPAEPPKLARGGALNALALGGRSDIIDAKLSPGEYVIDAETMALLGNGSVESGAKKMDQVRSAIRSHKGKALAKGKISPNAKSPLTYIKEVA